MDRFSDDRDDFEPAHSGFDPDEAISRYLARKAQRNSGEEQAEEDSKAELDALDEGEEQSEPENPPAHPHQPLHPPFPTHRPTFGRKGL